MQKIQSIDEQFHDGDGQTSMGTVVTAKFLNDVQNELCHVIDSAGIELDGQDDTQLLQAFLAVLRKKLSESDYVQRSDLDTKLDKTAKAADADKLDGHKSDYFATAAAVTQAQSSVDDKVSKSGDTITGKLKVKNNLIPVELINDQPRIEKIGAVSAGPTIRFIRPNIAGLFSDIYLEERKDTYHCLTIHLSWPGYDDNYWSFRGDGYLYGPHGRLVSCNDPSYDIGSYTIAVLRYDRYFPRDTVVSGIHFFDSDIGGDIGNDFISDRWWVRDHGSGNLPGTWRVMNPLAAAADFKTNSGYCSINLIKRIA